MHQDDEDDDEEEEEEERVHSEGESSFSLPVTIARKAIAIP